MSDVMSFKSMTPQAHDDTSGVTYSRVRNKGRGTFINFGAFFKGL